MRGFADVRALDALTLPARPLVSPRADFTRAFGAPKRRRTGQMPTGRRSFGKSAMNRPLDLPLISVDLSREADFSIGALWACPSRRQVAANGKSETVQPRVMQVLVALARSKGAVLSRDNLIEACWDGVVVGDDAINRCIAKVRQVAELGDGPHFQIETIPRVGYRLVAAGMGLPVAHPASAGAAPAAPKPTVAAPEAAAGGADSAAPARFWRTEGIAHAALAILIVALTSVSLAWVFRSASHPAWSPHREPLLAVLPFRNLDGGSGSRYFSDGITQEIVDALLQVTEIRVAAPSSSFALRRAGAARTAKALAATHVLDGSVERHASELRVVAQLMDMDRNRVIWSRIYRTTVAQTPALQHHIAMQIANTLDLRLSPRSLNDAAHIDPVAYDRYLRGRDMFRQRRDPAVAVRELETSVHLAPTYARAWSTLAAVNYLRAAWASETGQDSRPMLGEARRAANRALALDRDNGDALGVLAVISQNDWLAADRLFERGLRAEPNNTLLLNWHHSFLYSVGRRREAGEEIERAYELDRLNPAIIGNAAIDAWEKGDFAKAKQIIDLGTEYCEPALRFEFRAQYLLAARDWSGLARHLNVSPPNLMPQLAPLYRLAAETSLALDRHDTGKFDALRARWRAVKSGDRVYGVTFLTLFGDTEGALKVIESGFASSKQGNVLATMEASLLFLSGLPELRRDPKAKALMAKWGFFEYWRASNRWPDFCQEPGLPFDCKTEARRFKI